MVTFRNNNNRRNNFRRNDRNFKSNVIDKNKFGTNFSNNDNVFDLSEFNNISEWGIFNILGNTNTYNEKYKYPNTFYLIF